VPVEPSRNCNQPASLTTGCPRSTYVHLLRVPAARLQQCTPGFADSRWPASPFCEMTSDILGLLTLQVAAAGAVCNLLLGFSSVCQALLKARVLQALFPRTTSMLPACLRPRCRSECGGPPAVGAHASKTELACICRCIFCVIAGGCCRRGLQPSARFQQRTPAPTQGRRPAGTVPPHDKHAARAVAPHCACCTQQQLQSVLMPQTCWSNMLKDRRMHLPLHLVYHRRWLLPARSATFC
jgi:hypothetical protein